MPVRRLDDRTWVSGQIAPHEVAGLAGQGVTMLVNNRPDGEEPGQPRSAELRRAAEQVGLGYAYIPIAPGLMR